MATISINSNLFDQLPTVLTILSRPILLLAVGRQERVLFLCFFIKWTKGRCLNHTHQDNQIVFNETRITSFEFFAHPLYSTFDRRKHDIGLVRIKDGIPDNGYVKPICLNDRKPESYPVDAIFL